MDQGKIVLPDLWASWCSTLVVLKGRQEPGRIVAGTAKEDVKALLDPGLADA